MDDSATQLRMNDSFQFSQRAIYLWVLDDVMRKAEELLDEEGYDRKLGTDLRSVHAAPFALRCSWEMQLWFDNLDHSGACGALTAAHSACLTVSDR